MGTLLRDFYDRDPIVVARDLLGKLIIRRTREGVCVGKIVETEAYLSKEDPACHSHRGQNRKNATMFGPPGHLYVYPIHVRYCMNAVTEGETVASAVLIRAAEPLEGLELMRLRRGQSDPLALTRGPARLCEAFGVRRDLDGWNLMLGTRIWIAESEAVECDMIGISPRIGVTSAHDHQLRFFLRGNPLVSGPKSVGLRRTKGPPNADV